MRWCSLNTNEYDLQAIMYPIICKYRRLNTNNGNNAPVFPGYIYIYSTREHLDWALSSNASKFGPQSMKYELCLNGLLLSDILPYPLFHCHDRLPVIRVCFAVCLMSHYFRYPQITASGYLNLASVIAGPNTCGLTIVATLQHETLGNHIHVKWLAPNVYIYIYIYIYMCVCVCV